jgi:hypothetical protein
MMMVIVVREQAVHIERQYTNAKEIWQAQKYLGVFIIKVDCPINCNA